MRRWSFIQWGIFHCVRLLHKDGLCRNFLWCFGWEYDKIIPVKILLTHTAWGSGCLNALMRIPCVIQIKINMCLGLASEARGICWYAVCIDTLCLHHRIPYGYGAWAVDSPGLGGAVQPLFDYHRPKLELFYSIGRKGIYNPLRAGFVCESKDAGFFKTHSNAQMAVLRVPVSEAQLRALEESLASFQENAEHIKYSLFGLVYCYFGISAKRENKYFCSQFVAEILQSAGIDLLQKPPTLTFPHDFLLLPEAESIYTETFQNYCFG